jgi:exodeoxyribonuclease V alpha subunit
VTTNGPMVLEGNLERVVYEDREGAFVVARVTLLDGQEVTAVGSFAAIPGTRVKLEGTWIKSARYGLQFQVENAEVSPPNDRQGLVQYLSSGVVPGVGPVTARRLVEHFGEETLRVLDRESERLAEVPGIGPARVSSIRQAWEAQRGVREVMVFLQGHGVSPAFAHRIYKIHGRDTILRVSEDPYRLTREVFGIGFKKADAIAMRLGLARTSIARCRAGVLHVLQGMGEEGHVFCPKGNLLASASELLDVPPQLVEEAVQRCARDREVVLEQVGEEEPRVYLRWLHEAEVETAQALVRIRSRRATKGGPVGQEPGPDWEDAPLRLTPEQREIVRSALSEPLVVVTGGPGTGKTTAMRVLLERAERGGKRVLLAAPTGRAAKRLSEATGKEARTIHRLLEFQPAHRKFLRNRHRPLAADMVLVDEASMIDLPLMYHLTQAVPDGASLILVGDVDQLPSVGPGNVLRDIIASGCARVVVLHEVFRQSARSQIVLNAHRINRGEMPQWSSEGRDELSDFYFISQSEPAQIQQTIMALCLERIPARFGMDPKRDIQVLTPMHRGPLGTEELNRLLQQRLNPGRRGITRGAQTLSEGDRVMQIKNDYEKEVFNGDIGTVSKVERTTGRLWVLYEDTEVQYGPGELDELVLAYAISVHKSQGSEYAAVVLPVVTQHYLMLQRNLLYTGITRARRLVVLVGTPKALAIAVKNDQIRHRHTGLKDRLEGALLKVSG